MQSRTLTCITAVTLFAALAIPVQLAAQNIRYKLIDLGTPGGPNSFPSPAGPGVLMLNNAGTVAGWGDTTTPDPTCFGNDGLCLLTHAFRWKNGTLTDLGALPGTNSSAAVAINAHGWILGASENGLTDPISGFPESRAVLWKHEQPTELAALGNVVFAQNLNNVGQAIGGYEGGTPDPFSLVGFPTQTRAFLWQRGVVQDIGTLGGPDAFPFSINERGQIVGMSYTNAVPNETTGIPTLEPFLWDHGQMISLGTLGGTSGGPTAPGAQGSMMINNRGQIIGTSNLAGDQSTHAFVWEKGVMTDLGTFGGVNSFPVWINDVGEIVGEADLQGSAVTHLHHAFLWKKGVMTDLGTLGSTSHAEAVNSRGQVVGRSRLGDPSSILQHAFLWENGGPMVDLNTTIPANSGLQLIDAVNINDGGEILVIGLPLGVEPVGGVELGRLVLLVPCSGVESGCGIDDLATAASATATVNWTTSSTQRHSTTSGTPASWRARLAQRLHVVDFTGSRD